MCVHIICVETTGKVYIYSYVPIIHVRVSVCMYDMVKKIRSLFSDFPLQAQSYKCMWLNYGFKMATLLSFPKSLEGKEPGIKRCKDENLMDSTEM